MALLIFPLCTLQSMAPMQAPSWSRRAVCALPLLRPARARAAVGTPTDWGLTPELDRNAPSAQYVQNAEKLAYHLQWSVENVDAAAGEEMKSEIKAFSASYRKDKYTPYGIMPGFLSLQTAYDALSAHYARYGPGKEVVPDQLAGTISRNVADARKQISAAKRRAESAAREESL